MTTRVTGENWSGSNADIGYGLKRINGSGSPGMFCPCRMYFAELYVAVIVVVVIVAVAHLLSRR